MEDVEDAYTVYVDMSGISEDVFWNCDIHFVKKLADNRLTYKNWLAAKRDEVSRNGKR